MVGAIEKRFEPRAYRDKDGIKSYGSSRIESFLTVVDVINWSMEYWTYPALTGNRGEVAIKGRVS